MSRGVDLTTSEPASTVLARAAVLIGEQGTGRLLRGDVESGRRLARLAQLVFEESEMLEGIEKWGLPLPDRSAPEGVTVGWLWRYDAQTRRNRELHGLPNPYVREAAA